MLDANTNSPPASPAPAGDSAAAAATQPLANGSFGTPSEEQAPASGPLLWAVAHTRPRCEKKLKDHCDKEGIDALLPCYRSVKKYPGKTLVFQKPLFPNYVFLRFTTGQKGRLIGNRYVANFLPVVDQELFEQQLGAILIALEEEMEVRLAPHIVEGAQVRITTGPLRGAEGIVDKRSGVTWVVLRLDFISQGAAVRIEASDLELL